MSMPVIKMKAVAGLMAMLVAASAYAGDEAGLVKDAKGAATIERGGKKIAARPGTELLVSDRVVTGADGSVGITLHDGTMISAGHNSILTLNKFKFDSTTHQGELDASLKRGTLAVVSGKLSKSSPDAVKYRTPTSILGVRGTEFLLEAGGD
jgi:hypothetical protein